MNDFIPSILPCYIIVCPAEYRCNNKMVVTVVVFVTFCDLKTVGPLTADWDVVAVRRWIVDRQRKKERNKSICIKNYTLPHKCFCLTTCEQRLAGLKLNAQTCKTEFAGRHQNVQPAESKNNAIIECHFGSSVREPYLSPHVILNASLNSTHAIHEEAKTCISLHAVDAKGYQWLIIHCRDTDVLVLLLVFAQHPSPEIWIKAGTVKKPRYIKVYDIKLPNGVIIDRTAQKETAYELTTGDFTQQYVSAHARILPKHSGYYGDWEHRAASAQTVASAPPYPSSNTPSYPPYYHQYPVKRKAAAPLKFNTKSQLSSSKAVQFSTWVTCPPQAKQRDEVISVL
ncbi:hypothetical protein PAMP_022886 [Pampus punctatissimus]